VKMKAVSTTCTTLCAQKPVFSVELMECFDTDEQKEATAHVSGLHPSLKMIFCFCFVNSFLNWEEGRGGGGV
jgi:hypothetical protein